MCYVYIDYIKLYLCSFYLHFMSQWFCLVLRHHHLDVCGTQQVIFKFGYKLLQGDQEA